MGETERGSVKEAFSGEGVVSDDGLVIGTYMHGLFTNKSATDALVSYLYEKKGLQIPKKEEPESDPYDALADHLEKYVDISEIIRLFKSK